MIKLNLEDFTDEPAERLTYTEVNKLNSLDFLYNIDQKDVIDLLLSIVADADNQHELINYLINWNTGD